MKRVQDWLEIKGANMGINVINFRQAKFKNKRNISGTNSKSIIT